MCVMKTVMKVLKRDGGVAWPWLGWVVAAVVIGEMVDFGIAFEAGLLASFVP